MNEEIREQMIQGFQKLFSVVEHLSYGELEDMRREILQLSANVYNEQDKRKTQALNAKSKIINLEVK